VTESLRLMETWLFLRAMIYEENRKKTCSCILLNMSSVRGSIPKKNCLNNLCSTIYTLTVFESGVKEYIRQRWLLK